MWITTTTGYLSAVQATDMPDTLVVRARVRADLAPVIQHAQRASMGALLPEIITYEHSDYPWRVLVPKTVFAQFVAEQVLAVDYGNFKARVAETQGKPRANVYSGVWTALLGLERIDPEARPKPAPWWTYAENMEDVDAPAFMDEDDDDWYDVDQWLGRRSLHDLSDEEWLAMETLEGRDDG